MAHASFAELIKSDTPTFVDFSAEWCGPCKMMTPILDELKSKVGDTAKVIKVDIDKNPQMAAAYQVQNVPTLMLFKNNKVVWRQSGIVPSAYIKRIIDQHLAN